MLRRGTQSPPLANSVIGDTLCAFANGRKDDWDRQLPLAVFTINVASTLGPGAAADQGAARRGRHWQAAAAVGWLLTVTACPSPNYTLTLPARMQRSRTINVNRLEPFHERVDLDAPPAPGSVSDQGQEGEHEVDLLLNSTEKRAVTRYLVRWR
jgi:hypothetical protein